MKSRLQRSSTALLVAMVGLSLVFSAGCTKKTKKAKEATELPSDSGSDSKPTETSGIDSAPSGDAIDGKGSSDLASDRPRSDDTFAAADSGAITPAGGSTGGSFEGLESRHGSAAIGEPHGDAGLTPAIPAPVEEEIAQAPATPKKKKKGKKKKKADLEAPIETADAEPAAGGDDHSGGYVVKKGDVMSKIAKQHGVSLKSLLSANKMTMDQASKLKVGQKLKLPAGAGKAD